MAKASGAAERRAWGVVACTVTLAGAGLLVLRFGSLDLGENPSAAASAPRGERREFAPERRDAPPATSEASRLESRGSGESAAEALDAVALLDRIRRGELGWDQLDAAMLEAICLHRGREDLVALDDTKKTRYVENFVASLPERPDEWSSELDELDREHIRRLRSTYRAQITALAEEAVDAAAVEMLELWDAGVGRSLWRSGEPTPQTQPCDPSGLIRVQCGGEPVPGWSVRFSYSSASNAFVESKLMLARDLRHQLANEEREFIDARRRR